MRRTDKHVSAEDALPSLDRSRSVRFLARAVPVLLVLGLAGISGYFLATLLAPHTTDDVVAIASTPSTPTATTTVQPSPSTIDASATFVTAAPAVIAAATSPPENTSAATATIGVQMLEPPATTPPASSAPVEPSLTVAPATATVQPSATSAPATATVQPTATSAPATATVQPSATPVPTITVTPSVTATALLPAALLQQITQIEAGFQSGELEATIDYGTGSRSSARVRFDLSASTGQPRLDMLTTYASKARTETIEQIIIGEQAWERRGSEKWTAATDVEGVWGQVNEFLPHAARASTPQVTTSGDSLEVRWYDSSSDADVILQIDPQTHIPRQLQRITRTNRTVLNVDYRGWNSPVEIVAPTLP